LRVSGHVRTDNLAEQGKNFSGLRMAAEFAFREYEAIIDHDFKDALTPGDKCKGLDDVLVVPKDFLRHTGGARQVVSGHAVFDGDGVLFFEDHYPVSFLIANGRYTVQGRRRRPVAAPQRI
jgi:hypothetical protein